MFLIQSLVPDLLSEAGDFNFLKGVDGMGFQRPTGTQDILPGEVEKWQFIEKTARELCRAYNYKEIRTPIFEGTELFQRGVGETTDIVEKEMYTFEDKGGRSMTLRPEGTAGVVRAYVENKLYGQPDVSKLFYIGPMFRYERPQAGRYRQLHQFGIEVFGAADASIDAEVISLGYMFYSRLGLTGVTVEINSVGNPESRALYRTKLQQFLKPKLNQLCEDCQKRYDKNPLRVLDCKEDQRYFDGVPSIFDSLDEESLAHFEQVKAYLTQMDIPFVINPKMVRGLDYYTHTAFEYKAQGIGAIDTIGGGGRFNGLVSSIGGQDQPGIGLGLGMERALLLMKDQGIEPPAEEPLDLYIVTMGEAAKQAAVKLLYDVRQAGLSAEMDYLDRKTNAKWKAVERNNARYAGIIGDDELVRGEVTVRTIATREQVSVPLSEVADALLARKI